MSFRAAIKYNFHRRWKDSVFALQFFNVMRFAAFFIVSILLVRIPLSVDQIASYEYVLFLSSIVTGWWIHGFIQGFMADGGQTKSVDKGVLFRSYSRLFFVFGTAMFAVVSGGIEVLAFYGVLSKPPTGFYFYLLFHFLLQGLILLIYYAHQKGWKKFIYLFSIYFFLIYVGSFFVLLKEGVLLDVVYRYLLVFALPVVAVWFYFYKKSEQGSPRQPFLPHVPHLTILMLIQGIGFLSLWSDGFWVQYFYGTGEVFAFFRYGGRELPFFVILTTTFSTAMIHASSTGQGLDRIKKGSQRFIRLFLPLSLILMLSSHFLFSWVYSDAFIPASFVFDLYVLLILVRVLFPRPILMAHRLFRPLLWVSVGELVINVVVSVALYWSLGVLGLILGTLAAHSFELGASLYLVRTRLRITMQRYVPVRLYLTFAITVVLAFVIKYGLFSGDWVEMLISP